MDSPKDSPSEVAKLTLTRLAKDRLMPLPENYCRTYREVDGKKETWGSFCHYTKLLEEALGGLLGSWQEPGVLVEHETARVAKELDQMVFAASSEEDLKRVRDLGHALGLRIKRNLANAAEVQTELLRPCNWSLPTSAAWRKKTSGCAANCKR